MAKFLTNLDLNLNEIQNVKLQILASAPTSGAVAGRVFYDSTQKQLCYHDGTQWVYIATPANIAAIISAQIKAQVTDKMGKAGGLATLGDDGKVPTSQLPSYVDDVLEYADYDSLPTTGEAGKIYVTLDDGKTYRWGGTAYAEISASLAIGETAGTAYDGAAGKALADKVAALENGAVNRYTGVLAAGNTSVTVTHDFNSTDVLVQTYDKSTGETVLTEVARAANSVTVAIAQKYDHDIQVVVMK